MGIPGQNTVIIEEIGCDAQGGCGTVFHIADRGGDILSHILLGQCSFFHELIHLHAMTESLMGNQAGDGRIGDNVIDTGLNRLRVGQVMCPIYKRIHLPGKRRNNISDIGRSFELVYLYNLFIFPIYEHQHAAYKGVILIQFPVRGDKELGYFHGIKGYHGIEDMLTLALKFFLRFLTESKKLCIGIIIQIRFSGEGLDQRLILQMNITNAFLL